MTNEMTRGGSVKVCQSSRDRVNFSGDREYERGDSL